MITRRAPLALCASLLAALSACTGHVAESSAAQGVAVDVQPKTVDVAPGGSVDFVGTVSGSANVDVRWEVVEVGGGSIDTAGQYTAPAATGVFHVRASSVATPSAQAVATVNVTSSGGGSGTLTVSGNTLRDACGNVFVPRGIEQIFGVASADGTGPFSLGGSYTALVDQIAASGANAIRILPQSDLPASDVAAIIARAASHQMVVYVSNNGRAADANHVVDTAWLARADIQAAINAYPQWTIVDAVQEDLGNDRIAWRDAAIARVQELRRLGYTQPFTVIGPVGGRDLPAIRQHGAAIAAADPLGRTILGWQAYWGSDDWYQGLYGYASGTAGLLAAMNDASAEAFPIQIGVVNVADLPSSTVDYGAVISRAATNGQAWLYWDWWLPGFTSFDMSTTGYANALNAIGTAVVSGTGGVASGTKACSSGTPAAAPPTSSLASGTYPTAQSVTLSCSTPGCSIRYTTNGSTPTATSALYTSALSISADTTLKAIAIASGYGNSATATWRYVIGTPAAAPTCSPPAGTYSSAQTVTCSSSTAGSTTRCTVDGSAPTSASPACTNVSVASSLTLRAYATAAGFRDSAVADHAYTVSSIVGSCDTAPLRSTGTTYYYCDCAAGAAAGCVAGNDANAGTSASAPRRTLANARDRFGAMAQGSTVALCRGGAWTSGFGALPAKTCGTTEATWCDIRDYVPSWGTQATPKPLIAAGGTQLNVGNGGHVQGARLWNFEIRSSSFGDDGQIQIFDGEGLDLCNVTVSGGKVGLNIQTGGTLPSTMRESTVTLIGQTGIYQAASNWTFDKNTFVNNQQATSAQCGGGYCGSYYNHDHYVSGVSSNVVIKNSEYYTDAAHCTNAERCAGVVIYWTDRQTNPVFENNYVHGPGQASRYAFSSSNNAASTVNTGGIIRRNRFDMPTAGTVVEVSCCTNCVVTDNVVIAGPGRDGFGVAEQGSSSPSPGTVVRNNTIYYAGAGGTGVNLHPYGTGYAIENNVVYGASGTTCFTVPSGRTASGHDFTVTTYPSTSTNGAGNYCVNNGAAASVLFANAPSDFTPAAAGPLAGTGNSATGYYSPTAIGSITWNPADPGAARSPPVDIGALRR